MTPQSLSAVDILSLAAALSHYCGAEGQINLHKLLEAAIYSVPRRAAFGRTGLALADLAPTVADLRTLGVAPELAATLERGAEIARTGGVPLTDATPDVFVCRVCGHTALAAAPSAAPPAAPGQPPSAASWVSSTWTTPTRWPAWRSSPRGRTRWSPSSATSPRRITTRTPAPGEWSIQRALQHLVDAQDVFAGRLEAHAHRGEPAGRR